jgi:hypothetical protein
MSKSSSKQLVEQVKEWISFISYARKKKIRESSK